MSVNTPISHVALIYPEMRVLWPTTIYRNTAEECRTDHRERIKLYRVPAGPNNQRIREHHMRPEGMRRADMLTINRETKGILLAPEAFRPLGGDVEQGQHSAGDQTLRSLFHGGLHQQIARLTSLWSRPGQYC